MNAKKPTTPERGPLGVWRVVEREGAKKTERVGRGAFDELTVDAWLHVEQLEEGVWWMRIGDARVTISLGSDGPPTVDIQRGFYGEVRGATSEHDVP